MIKQHKSASIFTTVLLCVAVLSVLFILRERNPAGLNSGAGAVNGIISPLSTGFEMNTGSELSVSDVDAKPGETAIPAAAVPLILTPFPSVSSISFDNIPGDIKEGEMASFTWTIGGNSRIINTTAVYLGTKSNPGVFSVTMTPENSGYPLYLPDFLKGDYNVPLRFVGAIRINNPGIYYARAYTNIDGENIWSDERSFTVSRIPVNGIRIVNPPEKVSRGTNQPFTWEIVGPDNTTTFTTIVIGKLSKPGQLDDTVDIPRTPYAVLIKDFTGGNYRVPLRFVGNASFSEAGDYYYRALTYINNKNIWSEEYKLTVE